MAGRQLPKTLTASELELLMGRPNLAAPTGLRNRAMLALMHRCGLRASEVCGLYLRDVDWKEGSIRIRGEVAKGGREAVVYTDPATLALLDRWKVTRRKYAAGKPHLFTTLKGGPVDRRYVWEMVARYARRAGIDRPVWPHMLRHTYATELLAEGFTIAEVQALMRHADMRTTALYLHIHDENLRNKIRGRGD